MPRPREQQHLAALAEVDARLRDAGIDYWLFGGWAVDFYADSVTRPHDHVDVAVWLEDVPRIAELLVADGWRHAPDAEEDGGTGYERDAVRLELTFLVRQGDDVLVPLRHGRGSWPKDTFGTDRRELQGTGARLVSLASLRESKSSGRDDPDDAAKDRADVEELSRIRTHPSPP